jgi:hypothetical protein
MLQATGTGLTKSGNFTRQTNRNPFTRFASWRGFQVYPAKRGNDGCVLKCPEVVDRDKSRKATVIE